MESAKLFVTFLLLGVLTTYLHFSNHVATRVSVRQILSFQDKSPQARRAPAPVAEEEPRICTTTMLHELAESADPKVRCIVTLGNSPSLL